MNLTEHFSYEELVHSDTALRLGIDNTPPEELKPHLVVLAQGLEQIRRVLERPITVNRGYSCEALERVLCWKDFIAWCGRHGKPCDDVGWYEYFRGKAHPKGFAGDFTCWAFGAPAEIVRVVRGSGIKFDQLICEGTWVHASFDPRLRGEVLSATFRDGTPFYERAA